MHRMIRTCKTIKSAIHSEKILLRLLIAALAAIPDLLRASDGVSQETLYLRMQAYAVAAHKITSVATRKEGPGDCGPGGYKIRCIAPRTSVLKYEPRLGKTL
jgi:hypothetical protein